MYPQLVELQQQLEHQLGKRVELSRYDWLFLWHKRLFNCQPSCWGGGTVPATWSCSAGKGIPKKYLVVKFAKIDQSDAGKHTATASIVIEEEAFL